MWFRQLARFGPWQKLLITTVVLAAVGWRLGPDLANPELWRHAFEPGWLVLCGVLYVLGLGCAVAFWYRLLRGLDQHPPVPAAIRSYFLGLLGKYVPGKAWALLLRAGLVRGPRTRLSVATMTAFYEVLTTMASGSLLAAIVFATLLQTPSTGVRWHLRTFLFEKHPPDNAVPEPWSLLVLALVLLAILGVPLLPPVFNWIVGHMASLRRVVAHDNEQTGLPRLRLRFLGEGLLITAGCWFLWGLSLWAAVRAMLGTAEPWTWQLWLRYTAIVGVAYVSGFVILIVPSGLGIREFLLVLLLVPELTPMVPAGGAVRPTVVLVVLLLRVVWTVAELVAAAAVYGLPGPRPAETRAELAKEEEQA